ncbi:snaclec bothroinsularin subunit beta-like [Mobula birostris]|uniref:snaclec bothroinsularin subunit beta-like n=1 Tax=Mobula birostris TaxID=1983395 RepID=UPI003B280FBF
MQRAERERERRNVMQMWVLVVTALLVSDVAGSQQNLEKHGISRGPCEEKWFYFPPLNSCYRFFSDKMTLEKAENFCNQEANCGQLASVISDEHNTFVSNVISIVSQKTTKAWIALNDICKEENFTWTDGSSYSYKNFGMGEPNNKGGIED